MSELNLTIEAAKTGDERKTDTVQPAQKPHGKRPSSRTCPSR